MDITTEAGPLFDNHPRLKNKALLLDITIVNPCAGSNRSFDNIRDSPEAKSTIQIYFCTPTVQLLLLCLRTI